MTNETIKNRLMENGIPFTPDLPEKLRVYMELLTEWNAKMDLTAVLEENETLDKHFIDSLMILKTELTQNVKTMIDVGTGAGFPGLVIALACPEIKVTLLDAQMKRLKFLEAVVEQLHVTNVRIAHDRAEDGARKPELREQFDLAVARAVAPLNVLCEYLLPYVKVGGKAVCWKGPALTDEMEQGSKAAVILGGKVGEKISCLIPGRDWEHNLLTVHKVATTSGKYPRKAGTPKNSPLGAGKERAKG